VAFRRTRLVDRARRMALEASRAPPALSPYVGKVPDRHGRAMRGPTRMPKREGS